MILHWVSLLPSLLHFTYQGWERATWLKANQLARSMASLWVEGEVDFSWQQQVISFCLIATRKPSHLAQLTSPFGELHSPGFKQLHNGLNSTVWTRAKAVITGSIWCERYDKNEHYTKDKEAAQTYTQDVPKGLVTSKKWMFSVLKDPELVGWVIFPVTGRGSSCFPLPNKMTLHSSLFRRQALPWSLASSEWELFSVGLSPRGL